ncbi:hypothetical protein [Methylobrevis albus]|uniref:DUF2125 domain-containing protein n=1 Tax=Methylobrevis albus TaxID=2793297 RepID=A0A931MWV8_9HYPH|nr:hypothetical protein [Methylobrevis albus]MBH0237938.1 hypothetical protein [Methylobrevis albus]
MFVDKRLFITRSVAAAALAAPLFAGPLLAVPALAAEATAEGARTLAGNIAAYVGQPAFDKGYVTVGADGDAYRIDLDLGRIVGAFAGDAINLTVYENPWIRTMPVENGLWRVTDFVYPSLKVEFGSENGEPDFFEWRPEGQSADAVFDPELGGFQSFRVRVDRTTTQQKMDGQESRTEESETVVNGRDTRNVEGGFDSKAELGVASYRQTMMTNGSPAYTLSLAPLRYDFEAIGMVLRPIDFLPIIAALSAEATDGTAEEAVSLKAELPTMLPGFRQITSVFTGENIVVELPAGRATAESIRLGLDFPGAIPDARVAISMGSDGVALPAGVLPAWTTPLLPTGFDAELALEDLDLDAPARLLIDRADFNSDQPLDDGDFEAAGRVILPDGALSIVLEPSTVTGPLYTAAVEGRFTVSHDSMKPRREVKVEAPPVVEGSATIALTNLDGIIAELQKAGDVPEVQQAIPALIFAKGLARNEGGRSVWEVDVAANGSVSVNGQMLVPPSR